MIKQIYYLDLENYILDRWWNHAMYPLSEYLTGTKRVYFKPWIKLIIKHLDDRLIYTLQNVGSGWG
jgi:hypothetical protein